MARKQIKHLITTIGFGVSLFVLSFQLVHAQAFVPVVDINMEVWFPQYMADFNTYRAEFAAAVAPSALGDGESVADLISGANPSGIAAQDCLLTVESNTAFIKYDPFLAPDPAATEYYADIDSPFGRASYPGAAEAIESIILREFGTTAVTPASDARRQALTDEYIAMVATLYYLPADDLSGVGVLYEAEVNDSGSLRCLMEELVEWRKLDLNLTIHQMVKEYFADAGVYVMSKRIQDIVAAATANWAQSGMQQTLGPTITANTSAFVDNPEAQLQRVNTALRGGTLDQIQGSPTGYEAYELCAEQVPYVHTNIAVTTVDEELDSLETFPQTVACSDTTASAQTHRQNYAEGGMGSVGDYMGYMFSADNPVVSSAAIDANLSQEIADAEEMELRQLDWGEGTLPTEACVNPDDPYCRVTQVSTPAAVNSEDIDEIRDLTWSNLSGADEFGETPSGEQQSLSLELTTSQSGLLGYDTNALTNPLLDPIDKLDTSHREFINTIDEYFGIEERTEHWAINSLVNTWDNVQSYAGLEEYLSNVLLLSNI